MYQIDGVIEGVAPILFSRWTSTEGLKGPRVGGEKFTEDERDAEALQKVYRLADGSLGMPAWNFKKCLLEGCTKAGLKEGRSSMMPFLSATVFVAGDLSFGVTAHDFVHQVPGRRPPKTGGACLIKRPGLSAGWRLPFSLTVADERRSVDAIRRALEEAGMLVGLGSWRPEYGRFIVSEWSGKLVLAA